MPLMMAALFPIQHRAACLFPSILQLYYDLFSVETSDDTSMEAEQGSVSAQQQQSQQQHSQQQQQPQQQQQQHSQQPQQQQQQINGLRQSEAGLDGLAKDACLAGQEASLMGSQVASIESIEDGELVGARLPSGLLREPPAPGAQPLKQEPAEGQSGPAADGPPTAVPTPAVPLAEAGAATEDVGMEAESGFEAEDAAAALQHLAALPSAAWQDGASAGEDSEGDGGWVPGRKRRAGRAPSRGPPERRPRKQRPAKLWCRYPLDDERWALILSQSAISSRQISLPWTQPGRGLGQDALAGVVGSAALVRDGGALLATQRLPWQAYVPHLLCIPPVCHLLFAALQATWHASCWALAGWRRCAAALSLAPSARRQVGQAALG